MVDKIVKRDEKRRKRIKAAGIDYECPPLVSNTALLAFWLIKLLALACSESKVSLVYESNIAVLLNHLCRFI